MERLGATLLLLALAACSSPYSGDAADAGGSASSSSSSGGGPASPATGPSIDSGATSSGSTTSSGDARPDASSGGIGCRGQIDCMRYVFVTSKTYDAVLGGAMGADAKCQLAADNTTGKLYGRAFRAWISTRDSPANARHPHGSLAYRLPSGTLVAKSWADLVDGQLIAPIAETETEKPYLGAVWTGTNTAGDVINQNCDDWITTGGTGGAYGNTKESGAGWTTKGGVIGCATSLPLYCLEY